MPQLIKCLPNDFLPIGLEVFVKNRKGVIVDAKEERDQHGGPITVHHIRYTHARGPGPERKWYPLDKEETSPCNYSFIFYHPIAR
jgi:hypothetical protein